MIRELKGTKAQDEKRYRLLDRLNSLIADDGSRQIFWVKLAIYLLKLKRRYPEKTLIFNRNYLLAKRAGWLNLKPS